MADNQHILVVCTAGQQRSPTAARMLDADYGVSARAVGIHPQAETHVTQDHIDWADVIIAMNERMDGHKTYLQDNFKTADTPITVFGIPDQYRKDDPQLISILEDKLDAFMRKNEN